MKSLFCFGIAAMAFIFGDQSIDYEIIANKITEQTAKKLENQKKLYLIGTGGKMMNDIQAMDMGFDLYYEVDLCTGQKNSLMKTTR
jgi:hypothetical protein